MLNGLDYGIYDAALDPNLYANFSQFKLGVRAQNKRELQRHSGLAESAGTPVIGLVTHLIAEKGVGLVEAGLSQLVEDLQA